MFFNILLQKTTLKIIFKKYKNLKCFGEKIKVLPHKRNFSPAMHGWGISPNNKRSTKLEKNICVKLIYSIKTNTIISFLSKFLVNFFRNSIKDAVSRAVPDALSGALKVALLRAMAIQSTFSGDSFK